MAIDLLQWARGIREELFRAFILDDMPQSAAAEVRALAESGIRSDTQDRPDSFVMTLQDWLHEREQSTPEYRQEMRCVLVFDVFIPEMKTMSPLSDVLDLGDDSRIAAEEMFTENGRWAGLVMVDFLREFCSTLSEWPVILFSGFGTQGAEERLRSLSSSAVPPVRYLDKTVKDGDPAQATIFQRASLELLHDRRLYFAQRLAERWLLDEEKVCGAFGLRKPDPFLLATLFDRGRPPPTRDTNERYVALKRIHKLLYGLLRSQDAQLEWLNAQHSDLDHARPIDLMASGRMENLIAVKSYVEFLAQRPDWNRGKQ